MGGGYFFEGIMAAALLIMLLAAGGCSGDEKGAGETGPAGTTALPSAGRDWGPAQRAGAAPDFELLDTDGNLWKLAELRGQVVFINFWATWCPPCREEMPAMQKLYETMPGDRFKMLTILSNDDPKLAANFAGQNGFYFPILLDPDSEVGKAYGITGVPETYIVGKQGILGQKYLGARDWDSPEAIKMLKDYMNR